MTTLKKSTLKIGHLTVTRSRPTYFDGAVPVGAALAGPAGLTGLGTLEAGIGWALFPGFAAGTDAPGTALFTSSGALSCGMTEACPGAGLAHRKPIAKDLNVGGRRQR